MHAARILVVFCYGLFGIAAQALLFREYVAALNARDVAIGLFFGVWFLWVAVGAFLFHKARRLTSQLAKAAELLLLAYVPAFLLHYGLIVFFHGSGAETLAMAAPQHVLWCLLSVAAPVSLLTGLLFPVLCRWAIDRGSLSIGRVYTLEAAGGVVGGLGVTALLHLGASTVGAFFLLAVLVCGAAAWAAWTESRRTRSGIRQAITAACLAIALGAVATHADAALTRAVRERHWSRIIPGGTFDGSFSTAQAEYLYGTDNGRWIIVRDGRVYETVGDRAAAGRIAAMALAQNTRAEHVLVIGDGLSVCESFLKSPNVNAVDWFAPDPAYMQSMLACLPETLQVSDPRLQCLAGDIRATLAGRPGTYDIVIVNLPGTVNAALSPFVSVQFFEHVRQSLRSLGLVVLGITGGENDSGDEPAYLGACVKGTLDSVFTQTILVPAGERTFFVSASTPYLRVSPVTLQTRFSLLDNASDILSPEDLSSVYRPDRVTEVLDSYGLVALPQEQLVGSDRRPSYYLGQLLQTAHDSGLSVIKPVQAMLRGGFVIVLASIVVLALVRLTYVIGTTSHRKQDFDAAQSSALRSDLLLTIGGSGVASIATFIVLTHAYQMCHGSLHVHMGLLSGLFMLGLTAGAAAVGAIVSSLQERGRQAFYFVLCVLLTLLGFQSVCLVGAGLWIDHPFLTQSSFAVWLLLGGLFCGGILVAAAKLLDLCAPDAEAAAARLEGADHLGAAIGSGLVALFLIPLLGLGATLYVIAAVVLANQVSAAGMYHQAARPGPRVVPHPVLTPIGYTLLGIVLCVIAGAHVLAYIERSQTRSEGTKVVEEWVEGCKVSAKTTTLPVTSKEVPYYEVRQGSRLKGYIFRSEDYTGTVHGYAGPMSVIGFADPNGVLIDFRITRSRETPRYISRIRSWMDSLKGKTVFGDDPLAGVNAVSGATLSSNAILRLLRGSGGQFAASVFGQLQVAQATKQGWMERINWPLACWGAGTVLAVGVICHGRLWTRLALLAFTAGIGGFWLNKQFSSDHMIRLLSGDGLLAGPLGGLCLLLGVPLLIVLFGNIYCGYLCPFGALQELIGLIVPRRFKARLPLSTIITCRFLKYAVLFILVVAFFATGSKRVIEADPLVSFFNRQSWSDDFLTSYGLIIAILMLLGTLLVTRMWCRYLCPTGAFLSLFNRAAWLARLLPAKKFGRCEFGLCGRDHLDCIYCDRCRYGHRLIPARNDVVARTAPNAGARLFAIALVCVALFTLAPLLRKAPAAAPGISAASEVQTSPETTHPRQRRPRD